MIIKYKKRSKGYSRAVLKVILDITEIFETCTRPVILIKVVLKSHLPIRCEEARKKLQKLKLTEDFLEVVMKIKMLHWLVRESQEKKVLGLFKNSFREIILNAAVAFFIK